jgi:8-oxo-dGTP pyrophosphatase MutT (NUDIX family)
MYGDTLLWSRFGEPSGVCWRRRYGRPRSWGVDYSREMVEAAARLVREEAGRARDGEMEPRGEVPVSRGHVP